VSGPAVDALVEYDSQNDASPAGRSPGAPLVNPNIATHVSQVKSDGEVDKLDELVQLLRTIVSAKSTAAGGGDEGRLPGQGEHASSVVAPASEVVSPPVAVIQDGTHNCQQLVKIGKFDGLGCLDVFLMKFETTATFSKWDEQAKLVPLDGSSGRCGRSGDTKLQRRPHLRQLSGQATEKNLD